jgi:hypothetical protein
MPIFRTAVSVLAPMSLAGAGYCALILMTPVTPANVGTQLARICQIGSAAYQLDEGRKLGSKGFSPDDCGCLTREIIARSDRAAAARTADTFRKVVSVALTQIARGKRPNERAFKEAGITSPQIAEFAARLEQVSGKCDFTTGA